MSPTAEAVFTNLQTAVFRRTSADLSILTGVPAPSVRRAIGELRAEGHNILTNSSGYRLLKDETVRRG
jgi:hypothetical protein